MEQLFSEKVDKFSNVVEAFLHFSSWTGLTLISTTAPNQKASFEHSSFLLTTFCRIDFFSFEVPTDWVP